jgi:tetratricopeptide (TPR) repeat protein
MPQRNGNHIKTSAAWMCINTADNIFRYFRAQSLCSGLREAVRAALEQLAPHKKWIALCEGLYVNPILIKLAKCDSNGGTMKTRRTYCRILVLSALFALIAAIPQQTFAQAKKGVDLYNSGQYLQAETVFREALKSNPKDTSNNYYLGLSVLLQDKHVEALDIFLKVQQSQDRAEQGKRPAIPDEYQINLAMARARLGLHQYADAWKNLEQARTKNASSDVYVYRGIYYLHQEKLPEAIKELEKAISLDDKNAYAYYHAGLAYYEAGQADKAVSALKMFLQLHPGAPEAAKAKEIVVKLC